MAFLQHRKTLMVGIVALFSAAGSNPSSAQNDVRPSDEFYCTPRGRDSSILPFPGTDPSLKCEMFRLVHQDCRQYALRDPTGSHHAYCLSLSRSEASSLKVGPSRFIQLR
jgi:hypothetical protein